MKGFMPIGKGNKLKHANNINTDSLPTARVDSESKLNNIELDQN
jgi:hypothetical protein